jgi:hypothetical protein
MLNSYLAQPAVDKVKTAIASQKNPEGCFRVAFMVEL